VAHKEKRKEAPSDENDKPKEAKKLNEALEEPKPAVVEQ
jgi:hypothetical protein